MANFDVISRTDQWQLVIKGMGTSRGPGSTIVTLNDAKSAGASIMHNNGGELHFTLPVDHPSIRAVLPKLTHYSLQIRIGASFVEKFAGLIWDMYATDKEVVFYGIDYLDLFAQITDTRYDPDNPDLAPEDGGSKYIDRTITDIVTEQLTYAIGKTNSPVGFIALGAIADMPEIVTIWSAWNQTLPFVTGLIDSHRQGTGIKTRISVKNLSGTYTVVIEDDPGADLSLSLTYKKPGNNDYVQGYQVIPFGDGWGTTVDAVGRTQEGLAVLYQSEVSPDMDPAIWGLFTQTKLFTGLADNFDMERRTKQAALKAGQEGRQMGIGLRSRVLQPENGYAICDSVLVDIDHGALDTASWGDGRWTIWGLTWEGFADAHSITNLVLLPQDGYSDADPGLGGGGGAIGGGGHGDPPGSGGRDHVAELVDSGSPLVTRRFSRYDENKIDTTTVTGGAVSGTWYEGLPIVAGNDWGCELKDNVSWPNTGCGIGVGAYVNECDYRSAYGFTMPADTNQIATRVTATITPAAGPGGCTPYHAHIFGSFCGSNAAQTDVRANIIAGTDEAFGLDPLAQGGQFGLGPGVTVLDVVRSMLTPGSQGLIMFGPDFHVNTTYACVTDILDGASINDGVGEVDVTVQMRSLLPGTYGWIDASPVEAPDGSTTTFTLIGGYTLVDRVTLNGLIMPDDSWTATDGSTITLIGWTPIAGDSFRVRYYIP